MSRRRTVALLAAGALACASAADGAAAAGTIERVSVSSSGAQASHDSTSPSVSGDGRWVAFVSTADDLVPGDTNRVSDVFLRDRATGETRRVSVRADGTQGDDDSDSLRSGQIDFGPVYAETSISADGRYVAFTSFATNLVDSGATNNWSDVFLYDRVANALRRVSTTPGGDDGAGDSTDARVTSDGTHVVFTTIAADLVPLHAIRDVVIADVATGELRQVCEGPDGRRCANGAMTGDASDGGRWVAFATATPNLVPGDGNGEQDVFVRDMASGAIERVSVTASGGEANGRSLRPTISADGCVVAFVSTATNLAPDAPAGWNAFVRDRCGGTTELVNRSSAGVAVSVTQGYLAEISDDGCTVAFSSPGLSAVDRPVSGLLLRDRCAGTTTRVDVASDGSGGNDAVFRYGLSAGDGRYVVFDTRSSNLVPGDGNGRHDVFLRDRVGDPPPGRGGSGGGGGQPAPPPAPGGGGGSGPGGGSRTRPRPLRIADVRLSRVKFLPIARGRPRTRLHGARLSLTVSEPATLTLLYRRSVSGVRVNGRCVPPRRRGRPRRGPRCTRVVQVGRARAPLRAGRNDVGLSGWVGGRPLPAARYRLALLARTPDGRQSNVVQRSIAILRP